MQTNNERILSVDIETEMKQSFISYAMTVIANRALPDVRDGFKPVHRRILYSMYELGMTADKPFRKSARIVGDVLGKYHPHGDTAVYDAMVRLAQPFSTRYMLVEGQGNFGSVDGDGAAAMRYTEARLSRLSGEMIRDIDKDTVDFYPNFDETLTQPAVMPSRFPNLLVNGSSGIAVGMATNIPPHNMREVVDGCVHMLDNPDCTINELIELIKGPDFPTGGIILGRSGIFDAYRTGRGRIVTRSKSEIEEMSHNRSRIVVTEIPYMVNKARLVEKIAELVHEKRVEGISDIRDESDRSGMRLVIELKRDVNPNIVLNLLYKHTQLQETFGVIMLALVNGEPKVLNLRECLYHYLEHQKDVIRRRTRFELDRAEARAHILRGLIIALDNIDAAITIIRSSHVTAEARERLMSAFGLTEKQAVAILDMRLQRLTGLERERLEEELENLNKTILNLNSILENDYMVSDIIKEELLDIKRRFGDDRRTEISASHEDITTADMIQQEDMAVTLTHFGYVKRLPVTTYRAQGRGGKGVIGMNTRQEDYVERLSVMNTHDDIMFFTNQGRVFELKCYEIPEAGRTARGTAIINLLQLNPNEKVTAMIALTKDDIDKTLVMATKNGLIKKTAANEFLNIRKTGIIAILLREGDELIEVLKTDGDAEIFLGTRNGMAIRFHEDEIRSSGRASMGVRSINLTGDDEVIAISIAEDDTQVLAITTNGFGKRTLTRQYRRQSRGGKGVIAIKLSERTGHLACQLLVHEDDDIILITDDGTVIRMPVSSIHTSGRNTIGVRMMRVEEGCSVVAVARAEKEDEEEYIESADAAHDSETLPDEGDDDGLQNISGQDIYDEDEEIDDTQQDDDLPEDDI